MVVACLILLLLGSISASTSSVSAEEQQQASGTGSAHAAEAEADSPPPPCIEVYGANPEQPCPSWTVGEYNLAVGRTSQKRPVWHSSENSDALFRWHPRNGWIIGKLSDSTGMSYRCLKGTGVDTTPLGCDSYGHPDDVCKVRVCGTAASPPEVGDGAGRDL